MAVQEKAMDRRWIAERMPILFVLLEFDHENRFRIPDVTPLALLVRDELISETPPFPKCVIKTAYLNKLAKAP